MAKVLKRLTLTPVGGVLWMLADDLAVQINEGFLLEVLADFVSDGESGPAALKDLLLKPDTRRQIAAFIHDALYQAGLPKDWADSVYAEILRDTGVDPETDKALYEAVHLFGASSWDGDQADLVKKAAATNHLRITPCS